MNRQDDKKKHGAVQAAQAPKAQPPASSKPKAQRSVSAKPKEKSSPAPTPITVRNSEQSRQLQNQWDSGFEARSRFNHQQPPAVRKPGEGFQRAGGQTAGNQTDWPTVIGQGARTFAGDIADEMVGALDYAGRGFAAAGQPLARTAHTTLTGDTAAKRDYMDPSVPMPWSRQNSDPAGSQGTAIGQAQTATKPSTPTQPAQSMLDQIRSNPAHTPLGGDRSRMSRPSQPSQPSQPAAPPTHPALARAQERATALEQARSSASEGLPLLPNGEWPMRNPNSTAMNNLRNRWEVPGGYFYNKSKDPYANQAVSWGEHGVEHTVDFTPDHDDGHDLYFVSDNDPSRAQYRVEPIEGASNEHGQAVRYVQEFPGHENVSARSTTPWEGAPVHSGGGGRAGIGVGAGAGAGGYDRAGIGAGQRPPQQGRQVQQRGAMDYKTGRRVGGPRGGYYNSLTRPPGAQQELKDRSTSSKQSFSRARMQTSSSRRANPAVLNHLMALTKSRNGHVAAAATRALGQIGMVESSNKHDSKNKAARDNQDSAGYYATPQPDSPEDNSVPLFRDTGGRPVMGVDPDVANSVRQSVLEYKKAGRDPTEMLDSSDLTPQEREAFYQLINPEAITYDPLTNQYQNDSEDRTPGMADGGQVPLPEDLMGTPEDALLGGLEMGGGEMAPPDALGGAMGGDDEGSLEEVDALLQMAFSGEESGGDPMDASGAVVTDPVFGDQAPTDSIPAMIDGEAPVNLDSGEFVIPKDVVMYFGTEKLQKMIEKARQGAGQAPDQAAEMPING